LGDGIIGHLSTPGQVGGDTDWAALTAGYDFSCGRKSDDTLWCCGDNSQGQLGDGSGVSTLSPQQVGSEADWQRIAAGSDHACAIREQNANQRSLWGCDVFLAKLDPQGNHLWS
jgi:alpha-tubulin suppressor-like RCC1 family protein